MRVPFVKVVSRLEGAMVSFTGVGVARGTRPSTTVNAAREYSGVVTVGLWGKVTYTWQQCKAPATAPHSRRTQQRVQHTRTIRAATPCWQGSPPPSLILPHRSSVTVDPYLLHVHQPSHPTFPHQYLSKDTQLRHGVRCTRASIDSVQEHEPAPPLGMSGQALHRTQPQRTPRPQGFHRPGDSEPGPRTQRCSRRVRT